jgi:hypothetical protein
MVILTKVERESLPELIYLKNVDTLEGYFSRRGFLNKFPFTIFLKTEFNDKPLPEEFSDLETLEKKRLHDDFLVYLAVNPSDTFCDFPLFAGYRNFTNLVNSFFEKDAPLERYSSRLQDLEGKSINKRSLFPDWEKSDIAPEYYVFSRLGKDEFSLSFIPTPTKKSFDSLKVNLCFRPQRSFFAPSKVCDVATISYID